VKVFFLLKQLLAESKVSNFQNFVMDKNILRFDVSVNDVVLVEILEGVQELLEVHQYLIFCLEETHLPLVFKEARQIFVVAILKHHK